MENNIIRFNSYKLERGGLLYDMYDQFNARVGDQGTPLVMQWTQGLADTLIDLQAKKLHFYAAGQVGQYLEKLKDGTGYQMSADASQVEYEDRNAAGTMDHGITKVKLPKQFFPQEGIFYGYFGLKDDQGNTYTSVNVWFRVLGGVPIMGAAIPYFSTRFDELMETCQGRIEDVLIQLQKEIQDKIQSAENAIDDNIASLKKLAAAVGAIQAQINAGNVITRKEYNDLATKIDDRLATINDTPTYFASADDMKSKCPNGNAGLNVTLDTNHKWIYSKGVWQDCGPYSFANLDPEHLAALDQPNPDNLVANSDLRTTDNWTIPTDWGIDSGNAINNSRLLSIDRKGLTAPKLTWAASDKMPVGNHSSINFGWQVKANGLDYSNGNTAWIELVGYDPDDKQTFSKQVFVQNDPGDIEIPLYKAEGIAMPNTTKYVVTRVVLGANGYLLAGRPRVNFGDTLLPYSAKELAETISNLNNNFAQSQLTYTGNILGGHAISDIYFWSPRPYSDKQTMLDNNTTYQGMPTVRITSNGSTNSTYLGYKSIAFPVNQLPLSFQVPFNFAPDQANDNAYVEIAQYVDQNADPVATKDYYPQITNRFYLFKIENIELAPNVKYLQIRFVLQKNGTLNVGNPWLNYGKKCLSYSNADIIKSIETAKMTVSAATKNALTEPFNSNFYHYVSGYQAGINFDSFDENNHTLEINVPDNVDTSWTTVDSDYIKTYGNVMSYSVRTKTANADSAAIINLREFANLTDKDPVQTTSLYVGGPTYSKSYQKFYKENIILNDKTNYVVVRYTMQKHGDTHFTDPVLNWSSSLYAHDFGELSNQFRLPQLHLNSTSQINNDYSATSFSYRDGERLINGFMQIAWQGSSSRSFPKKNFKVKLFSDADCNNKLKLKLKSDWKANNKFNLKANWIDATQARNLVNAKLFAQATAVTPFADSKVAEKLADTQNFGQMEGFPIEVYGAGGQYMGLYTLNTKKDEDTFGMDSKDATNEAITCEGVSSDFNDVTKTIDGETYATVVQDTASDELKTNFTKFLQFLNTASDDDFKAHLADYIDVKSVINTYLFGVLAQMWDFDAKSMILLTYDAGKTYYMIPYDMDSTWGLHFDGAYVKDEEDWKLNEGAKRIVGTNVLYKRIHKLFLPEVKAQYQYLRNSVWNNAQLITAFKRYINAIPREVYEREQALWPAIPSKDITSFGQIQSEIVKRANAMDQLMK